MTERNIIKEAEEQYKEWSAEDLKAEYLKLSEELFTTMVQIRNHINGTERIDDEWFQSMLNKKSELTLTISGINLLF